MKRLFLTALLVFGVGLPVQAQLDELPTIELPEFIQNLGKKIDEAQEEKPDYSHLPPKAEKQAKLQDLFNKLEYEQDADKGNLIAEEIWAIWLDSGSASVDMILRRATASDKKGDQELARHLYDHVTTLEPEYAEGWARSGRLAYEEEDYNRAVVELTQALIIEPRHFYALWTLGNILESFERNDEALEVYKQAHRLYPAMTTIKERKEMLENYVQGDIL